MVEGDSADLAYEYDGSMIKIKFTNEAFQQPFGPFFVMTHNADEDPLFAVGDEASEALAHLAENGDPSLLVMAYNIFMKDKELTFSISLSLN